MSSRTRNPEPPEGFHYEAEILRPDEEHELVAHIRELPLWEHSIAGVEALRYSITFRSLRR